MNNQLSIAVNIELGRAHGRALIEGFASVAMQHPEWNPKLVGSSDLTKAKKLDGYDAFLVRIMDSRTAATLAATGKPVVDLYGRHATSGNANRRHLQHKSFSIVNIDDRAVATTAAEYFLEHRFTRIAYCGFPGIRFSDDRGRLFADALAAHGLSVTAYAGTPGISDTFFLSEKTDRIPDLAALVKWLKTFKGEPIAVFCCNDLRAFQLSQAAAKAELTIPADLALLGVDHDTAICTFATPPLSSLDTDAVTLGRLAAHKLEALLSKRGQTPFQRGQTPTVDWGQTPNEKPIIKVIERVSTDFYQFKTSYLSEAISFIKHNLSGGVNADEVFRYLGKSHTAVEHAFRNELGHGVGEEIRHRRLALAQRLKAYGGLTLSEIAHRAGYSSPQYLCRSLSEAAED